MSSPLSDLTSEGEMDPAFDVPVPTNSSLFQNPPPISAYLNTDDFDLDLEDISPTTTTAQIPRAHTNGSKSHGFKVSMPTGFHADLDSDFETPNALPPMPTLSSLLPESTHPSRPGMGGSMTGSAQAFPGMPFMPDSNLMSMPLPFPFGAVPGIPSRPSSKWPQGSLTGANAQFGGAPTLHGALPWPYNLHHKEMQMKLKMAETRALDERLRLQQKHDAAVQKIIERKNDEIEEVKNFYRQKLKEQEDLIVRSEEKLQAVLREVGAIRDSRDRQIAELTRQLKDLELIKNAEMDQLAQESAQKGEADKAALREEHSRAMNELVEDTQGRLKQMEHEYRSQLDKNNAQVSKLEERVNALTMDADSCRSRIRALDEENAQLADQCAQLRTVLLKQQEKCKSLEEQYAASLDEHRNELDAQKRKNESTHAFLRQEQAVEQQKLQETIEELNRNLEEVRDAIRDKELEFHRKLQEMLLEREEEKRKYEAHAEDREKALREEWSAREQRLNERVQKLKGDVREKDTEINKLTEQKRILEQSSADRLRDAVHTAEKSADKLAAEYTSNLSIVERELSDAKILIERQTREFENTLRQMREQFEKEIQSTKERSETERSGRNAAHQSEMESLSTKYKAELDALRLTREQDLKEHSAKIAANDEKHQKRVSELEGQLRVQRAELSNALLARQQLLADSRAQIEQLTSQLEAKRTREVGELSSLYESRVQEIKKRQEDEQSLITEKLNLKLNEIQSSAQRDLDKANETIKDLRATLNELKIEYARHKDDSGQRVHEYQKRGDEAALKAQAAQVLAETLERKLAERENEARSLELEISHKDDEHANQIRKLRIECEAKMRGLLNASAQRELEETIIALKSQVLTLQNRLSVLTEETATLRRQHQTSFFAQLPSLAHSHVPSSGLPVSPTRRERDPSSRKAISEIS